MTLRQIVSFEAGGAITGSVVSFALVRNRNADLVGVEDPSVGALQADLICPVPGSTSGISRLGVVGGREDAGTVNEVVALEAGSAGTGGIVSAALVGNGNADLVGVEDPVL